MIRGPTTQTEQTRRIEGLFSNVIWPQPDNVRAVTTESSPVPVGFVRGDEIVEGEFRVIKPCLEELVAQFVLDVRSLGLEPELVALQTNPLNLRPIPTTTFSIGRWPKEAQAVYKRVNSLGSSKFFRDWTVLEEIPPPAPPPFYRRDPYLAVRLAEGQFLSVFHWD